MKPTRNQWITYAAVVALVAAAVWLLVARPIQPPPTTGVPIASSASMAVTQPATTSGLHGTGPGSTGTPTAQRGCREGVPSRLSIPALDVDAPFEPIGLDEKAPADSQGRHPLGNPKDRTKAGWYADGPRPGSGRGTVLTNGHTYRNNSAIFKEDFASRIAVGQVITIVNDNGSKCSYRVHRVWREVNAARDYPRIVASEHLYAFDGPERLFLATCGGSWNSSTQNYDDISLLIADPVGRD
jgi:hypothetical protein